MSELIGVLGKTVVLGLVWIAPVVCAQTDEPVTDTRPSVAPDIREDESKLKLQKGNFVAVPIPISDPTLDAGLIAGAAYFYAQTEEQRKAQPASVTGAAAMYTANDSRAAAIVQQNYWRKNRWRFTGALGAADLRLSLLAPDEDSGTASVDWRINGTFFFARLSRKVSGNWYAGVFARTVDANQSLGFGDKMVDFDTNDEGSVSSPGIPYPEVPVPVYENPPEPALDYHPFECPYCGHGVGIEKICERCGYELR